MGEIYSYLLTTYYFLCYHKPIGNIFQQPWIFAHCLAPHLLGLNAVRNKEKCCQPDTHYLLAHLLPLKMIRNTPQGVCFSAHCLAIHLFCLKTVRDIRQWAWLHAHCSSHISCVLRWSGIVIIHPGTFANRDIFIHTLRPSEGQILWTGHAQARLVLNQRFIMTYSPLIFVCVTLYAKRLSQPTFFNDVFMAYFCMRDMPRADPIFTPQPTFFNDVFTTYLCMRHLVYKTTK